MIQKNKNLHLALHRAALEFEVAFFEKVIARDPEPVEALMVLGNNYTARGQYQEGLAVDLRLSSLRPEDALVHYNLACSYSLLRRVNEAVATLEVALALGYRDFEFLEKDPDLDPIRRDPSYKRLVERMAKV